MNYFQLIAACEWYLTAITKCRVTALTGLTDRYPQMSDSERHFIYGLPTSNFLITELQTAIKSFLLNHA